MAKRVWLLQWQRFICFAKIFLLNVGKGNRGNVKPLYRVLFLVGYVSVMVSYLMFAYKYPQQCSMHFRYIEITILFPTVALAMSYATIGNRKMRNIWDFVVTVFAVLSVLMCCVWCFVG